MRRRLYILCCFAAVTIGAGKPEKDRLSLNDLKWLAGCWQRGNVQRMVEEQWMSPSGRTMLGMSRTVTNGKLTEYEFVRLVEDSSGAIHYIAKPSGQPEASFTLVKTDGTEFVFENPLHDFPQRIVYRSCGPDSLNAHIEGMINGKTRVINFAMSRVRCN